MTTTHALVHDPAEAADLRRRRRRDLADLLTDRAAWLPEEDRALIHAVYREHLTAREVAFLRGATARRVRRRLRTLIERMLSRRFEVVLRERDGWGVVRRRIATSVVLEGRTLRETAERLGLTLHAVRRQMVVIEALIERGAS
jgi:DNA-directed RNA polymerase specialized sigma24 family protein